MKWIKSILLYFLGFRGLTITKIEAPRKECDALEVLLSGVIALEERITIVQVGANDGHYGDPIYKFVMSNKSCTKILLIEPQPDIIKHLEDTYEKHQESIIYNGAIGDLDKLSLYRVKPEFWQEFDAPYLKDAPSYRAPSGLTSSSKSHVLNAAKEYMPSNNNVENVVEEIVVPCKRLAALVEEIDFDKNIHLLQVDVEGADDEVLYACDLDVLSPVMINFESKHLPAVRKDKLIGYLESLDYTIFECNDSDTLAVKKSSCSK